jgi:putative redox protein
MYQAKLTWRDGWAFDAHSASGHTIIVDGKKNDGASPMEFFVIGLVGCTTVDVISILEKMRQNVKALEVELEADHKAEFPRYITTVRMNYWVKGKNIEEDKLKRAIELSHERYCSALHSLRPDVKVETNYEIENE